MEVRTNNPAMNRAFTRVLTAIALIFSLGCCNRPDSQEIFIKAADAAPGNVYSFEIQLPDSLAKYDLSFYSRTDVPSSSKESPALELNVCWKSPSGKSETETVYMNKTNGVEMYRRGVSPLETGLWTLDVEVKNPPKGFRGLGLVCEENGTR